MKKLFETAVNNIEELIILRTKQISLLNQLAKSKDAGALNFKIIHYKNWIKLLRDCINKGVEITSDDDIKKLGLKSSLQGKVIELFQNGEIKDIEEAKNDIINMEKQLSNTTDNLFNSINGHESANEELESPEPISQPISQLGNTKIKKKTKPVKTTDANTLAPDTQTTQTTIITTSTSGKGIDTSKIEAQPKILADKVRPVDKRGGSIFDLRYLYGIGPTNAEKLVDAGITLEKLLEDWTEWIKTNTENAILMISKLPIPVGYMKKQWDTMDEDKQRSIQIGILNEKLNNETRYLFRLNSHQLLGVKYFHDMSQKIPREEVQKAERILTASAKHMNVDIIITLCGSYRRGRAKSGDVDCLMTHPEIRTIEDLETYPVNILMKYVELLTNLEFLVDHLTDYGRSKYMGFCIIKQNGKKNNVVRRIDIRFIPFDSYGASILYFTGSQNFNTQMRSYAKTKGYSLSEYGLKRLSDNVLIPCKTEDEAFTILNYPYKTPAERDI